LEVIIIDDGSSDDTAQIAQQYPAVKYFYQPNSGVSSARNKGIDVATGEYIHFMDADDLINLEFYEVMLRAAVSAGSDMACCGFVYERYPSLNHKIEQSLLVSDTEDKMWMTKIQFYGACWRFLYKLSFLKEHKFYFNTELISGEDRAFSLPAIFHANKIVSVPGAVYIYKNRKGSITTAQEKEFVKKCRESCKSVDRFQLNFLQQHRFSIQQYPEFRRLQYKLLGIPFASKRVYHSNKTKWYFFNIPVFQRKEIGI
ncbi:MAG: glycosyltransferase, partial [Proteiniphilum sp.]|jgi:glycosyltransferase involved in cell wall biosynthesis|nr:glycosyltransferase [Proteiniphilum sp.]